MKKKSIIFREGLNSIQRIIIDNTDKGRAMKKRREERSSEYNRKVYKESEREKDFDGYSNEEGGSSCHFLEGNCSVRSFNVLSADDFESD